MDFRISREYQSPAPSAREARFFQFREPGCFREGQPELPGIAAGYPEPLPNRRAGLLPRLDRAESVAELQRRNGAIQERGHSAEPGANKASGSPPARERIGP